MSMHDLSTQPLSSFPPEASGTPFAPKVSIWEALRTRLTLSFVAAVLLPVLGIVFISTISGAQSGQRSATAQLRTILSYKDASVRTWARSVKAELAYFSNQEDLKASIQSYVEMESGQRPVEASTLEKTRQTLRQKLVEQNIRSQYFDGLLVLSPDGRLLIETREILSDPTLAGQLSASSLVRVGKVGPIVDASSFRRQDQPLILAGTPVVNPQNQVIAILAGLVKPGSLNTIMLDVTGLGETGRTYLVRLTDMMLLSGPSDEIGNWMDNPAAQAARQGMVESDMAYRQPGRQPVYSVFRQIPDLQAVLIAEQAQVESARQSYVNLAVTGSVALASVLVALFISLLVTRSVTEPVSELAETATSIAAGQRHLTTTVERRDEIGVLAEAFNSMTRQLRSLIESLEQRVAERTRELARRTSYLEASAEVGQATASILDLNKLLDQAVEVIRERFELYYVGLFLVDENRRWAVLRAGTGEAGKAMLARHHRLELGPTSMIGWSITNAQARIAQVATADEVRVTTPELPETRSEAAFPLRTRGTVIGAITVQSSQPNAFDQTSIAVLQQMADALAIAIDNARLLAESQQALEAERRAYAAQTQAAWEKLVRTRRSLSLASDEQGIIRLEPAWHHEMELALTQNRTIRTDLETTLEQPGPGNGRAAEQRAAAESEAERRRRNAVAIPIRVRGQVIGVLDVTAPPQGEQTSVTWSEQEIAFLENIAEQLGAALDSARLFEETQRRAERERLAGEITAKVRASTDPQAILDTAVRELRQALQAKRTQIVLQPVSPSAELPVADSSNPKMEEEAPPKAEPSNGQPQGSSQPAEE